MLKSKLLIPVFLSLGGSIALPACTESSPEPGISTGKTHIPTKPNAAPNTPNRDQLKSADDSSAESKSSSVEYKELLKGAPSKRFSTPGSVRFVLELDKAISFIRWSSLAGLVVSSGGDVHNITSKGDHRFRFVAGEGHRLFALENQEIVWSPEFGQLAELMRWGRGGWVRKWRGTPAADERGQIYLIDAGVVAAMDEHGLDKWRQVLDGVRKIDGPFTCEDGVLFQGRRGQKSTAVHIDSHGFLVEKIDLEPEATLTGASSLCEPLVWSNGSVALINRNGKHLFKLAMPTQPFVKRIEKSFVFLSSQGDQQALYKMVADNGHLTKFEELPIEGRITSATFISHQDKSVVAIGICSDVTSPCSKPGSNRGPFNTLITIPKIGEPQPLIRHVQGHLGAVSWPEGGLVTADSSTEEATDVTLRSEDGKIIWKVSLSGRLSAGPYLGPFGEVYVATCKGWDCKNPFLLISITGKVLEEQANE